MNLILTNLETWQTSFGIFTQIVSLRAYKRTNCKNLLFQQMSFTGNFTLVKCYARKVVCLGLRNFPLKQTKVTLIS